MNQYLKMLSVPPVLLCKMCLSHRLAVLSQITSVCQIQKRTALGSVQTYEKREAKKKEIWQYAGENTVRTRAVYAWGLAESGALGIARYNKPDSKAHQKYFRPRKCMARPARVRFFDVNKLKPLSVACGYGFSLIAVKRGSKKILLGTGVNTDSQLGYHETRQSGERKERRILDMLIEPGRIRLPVSRPDDLDIVTMACGRAHSVIVVQGQGVLSLGNNAYGQCGRSVVEGEEFSRNQHVNKLQGLPDDIIQVVCGQDHTLFLTSSGEVWACGLGADGQTGLGHYRVQGHPERVRGDLEGEKIVSLGGRADCSLAVSDKGELFGWGNSEYEQLASVTSDSQVNQPRAINTTHCGHVVKAVAGAATCAILNAAGQVYVWGYGILGKGPHLETSRVPSLIPPTIFGRNELAPDTKVTDIECGLTSFVAKTDNGDLFSWGRNNMGMLGLSQNTHKDQYFPWKVDCMGEATHISCGPDHMMAICRAWV